MQANESIAAQISLNLAAQYYDFVNKLAAINIVLCKVATSGTQNGFWVSKKADIKGLKRVLQDLSETAMYRKKSFPLGTGVDQLSFDQIKEALPVLLQAVDQKKQCEDLALLPGPWAAMFVQAATHFVDDYLSRAERAKQDSACPPPGDLIPKSGSKKRGRKPRVTPDKIDKVVTRIIANGDVEKYGWKELCDRYKNDLPKEITADQLRMRVNRALKVNN